MACDWILSNIVLCVRFIHRLNLENMTFPSLIWTLEGSLMLSMEAWILRSYPSFRRRGRLTVWKARRRFCLRWPRFWTAWTSRRYRRLTCFQTQRFFRLRRVWTTRLVVVLCLGMCKSVWLVYLVILFPLTAQEYSAFDPVVAGASSSSSVPQNLTITSLKVKKSKFPLLYPVIDAQLLTGRVPVSTASHPSHESPNRWCNFCSDVLYLEDWIFADKFVRRLNNWPIDFKINYMNENELV